MSSPANEILMDPGSHYIHSGNLFLIEMSYWEFSDIRVVS